MYFFVNLFGRNHFEKIHDKFKAFLDFISKSDSDLFNKELNGVIKKYSFLYLTDKLNQKSKIIQNLDNSSVIMINHYEDYLMENDELHFIIGFRKTILIVKQSLLQEFQPLFVKKDKLKICFCEDTKSKFDENINIKYEESEKNSFFSEEVSSISEEYFNNKKKPQFKYNEFLKSIKLCISGYLIQQSYSDLNYDRVKEFYSKKKEEIKPRKMEKNELVELRIIDTGSSFQAVLCYHIDYEKLCVIKKPISNDSENTILCEINNPNLNDSEIDKLLKREQYNYLKIKHPFIPKYYGTINIYNKDCIVTEFINGQTLSSTNLSKFSIIDRIKIITQL